MVKASQVNLAFLSGRRSGKLTKRRRTPTWPWSSTTRTSTRRRGMTTPRRWKATTTKTTKTTLTWRRY